MIHLKHLGDTMTFCYLAADSAAAVAICDELPSLDRVCRECAEEYAALRVRSSLAPEPWKME